MHIKVEKTPNPHVMKFFLGIKIFLLTLSPNELNTEKKINMEVKAVEYLKYAAARGYRKALLNLGWAHSIEGSSIFDLNKSAKYFNLANEDRTIIFNEVLNKNKKIKKKNLGISNVAYLEFAIAIMEKIKIYSNIGLDKKNAYLNISEFNKAEEIFKKILKKSNIPETNIQKIQLKVIKDHMVILNFLKKDIETYKREYRTDALKELKKLNNIYIKLN